LNIRRTSRLSSFAKINGYKIGLLLKSTIVFLPVLCLVIYSFALAQPDTTWQQVLPAWLDAVYYPNFFLGGNYITKVSLADIDGDGDLDMFYGGGDTGSLTYFENVGTAQAPRFELAMEEFPGLRRLGRETGIADADFGDLDADGDFDAVFARKIDGGSVLHWNDGTPHEAVFVIRPPVGPIGIQSNATLIDIDADGDLDCFSGAGYHIFQLEFAENTGDDTLPNFVIRSRNYQGLDFGVPFNFDMGDLDGDGDYDLLVCKYPGPVAYYENTGTPDSAFFTHVTDDFLSGRDTTDWMETPELADIDADGDLDLFLAGGYAHLYFFENTGNATMPQFIQRQDTSYFYLIQGQMGTWLSNAVDIDGDGLQDINSGRCFLLNQSSGGVFRFNRVDDLGPSYHGAYADIDADGDFDFLTAGHSDVVGLGENIGDRFWPIWASWRQLFPPQDDIRDIYSVAAGDLDADGDLDLLIGMGGSIWPALIRNDGTPQQGSFSYVGDIFLPEYAYWGMVHLALADMDRDGDLDLLLSDLISDSDRTGVGVRLFYYRNDGTPQVPTWTFMTSDFQNIILDHRQGGISVCPIDIENDGDYDLAFSACFGLQLYMNPENPVSIVDNGHPMNADDEPVSCYPNPTNSLVLISIDLTENSVVTVEIFNILGQHLAIIENKRVAAGFHRFIWKVDRIPSGIYLVKVSLGERIYHKRLTVLK